MEDKQLELTFLRQAVEKKYGYRLSTTADFTKLSEEIESLLGETCSPSTIKRLWGYVGMQVEPRRATLDILARFSGFRDFKAFCEDLENSTLLSSGYFQSDHIDSSALQTGDRISIGWRPDRVVTLEYLGSSRFKVEDSVNSHLEPGDEFEASSFLKGYPLYLTGIDRNGTRTPPFVAGRDGGIVFIKKA